MNPIRVLIVDDSAVVRGLLVRALQGDPEITVAGTAIHGFAALRWLESNEVDVVILDVEMPVMDGLTALAIIHQKYPHVRVIMASTLTYEGGETTIKALSLGAASCIAKPAASSVVDSITQLGGELLPLVKALGRSSRRSREPEPVRTNSAPAHPLRELPAGFRPRLIVVGSSTGGPKALTTLLTKLPTNFPVPILIVQHLPPTFTGLLAKQLSKDTGRPCVEAQPGQPIQAGFTYIAPGNHHLVLQRQGSKAVLQLNDAPPEHYCKPSVNPLFRSAADLLGSKVLGLMLTGMGEDGLEGAKHLVHRGGGLLAQDESSSVVWGMPGAVTRAELVHQVLPLDRMAAYLLQLCAVETCIPC